MAVWAELILGAVGGWMIAQLYWERLFVPYPELRWAVLGLAPALLVAWGSAWCWELLLSLSRKRRGVRFSARPFGVALFLNAFLQIEAMKWASEGLLSSETLGALMTAGIATMLTAQWLHYQRTRSRLWELARPPERQTPADLREAPAGRQTTGKRKKPVRLGAGMPQPYARSWKTLHHSNLSTQPQARSSQSLPRSLRISQLARDRKTLTAQRSLKVPRASLPSPRQIPGR